MMMEHFSDFNTRGISREAAMDVAIRAEHSRDFTSTIDGVTVGLSSGTSGHRGLFLVSPDEQAGWAGIILARTLHRYVLGLRVAFFLRSNSNLYEQIGSRLIHFRYFDLMLPPGQIIDELNVFAPHIVVGPPSLLGFLADARERGDLRISLHRLIAVAEVLEPQDRDRIAAVFAAPVHQIYQCTEGLLAISCPAGSLHIQEDLVAVQCEPLPDSNDRYTPIVTDLWRRAQPIIRYRLNDVLQLAPVDPVPCRCGSFFRVIRAIEGRCDDMMAFLTPSGAQRAFYPDTIRRMILLAGDGIADYAAEQARPGHLRVSLAISPHIAFGDAAQAVRNSIDATLASYDCYSAEVEIAEGIPPTPPGVKRRRVRRLYS
jgi:phenylacetate-CoA ligase